MLRDHAIQEINLRRKLVAVAELAIEGGPGFDGVLIDVEELKKFIAHENEVIEKLTKEVNAAVTITG